MSAVKKVCCILLVILNDIEVLKYKSVWMYFLCFVHIWFVFCSLSIDGDPEIVHTQPELNISNKYRKPFNACDVNSFKDQ